MSPKEQRSSRISISRNSPRSYLKIYNSRKKTISNMTAYSTRNYPSNISTPKRFVHDDQYTETQKIKVM